MSEGHSTSDLDVRAKVVRTLSCMKCEYSLESLGVPGACPECGLAIIESLNGPASVSTDTIQSFRNALVVICIGGGLISFSPITGIAVGDPGLVIANLLLGLWCLCYGCGLLALVRAQKTDRPFVRPVAMHDRRVRSILVLATIAFALTTTAFIIWVNQLDEESGLPLIVLICLSCATVIGCAAWRVARLTKYIHATHRTRAVLSLAALLMVILLGIIAVVISRPIGGPRASFFLLPTLMLSGFGTMFLLMIALVNRALWASKMLAMSQKMSGSLVQFAKEGDDVSER